LRIYIQLRIAPQNPKTPIFNLLDFYFGENLTLISS